MCPAPQQKELTPKEVLDSFKNKADELVKSLEKFERIKRESLSAKALFKEGNCIVSIVVANTTFGSRRMESVEVPAELVETFLDGIYANNDSKATPTAAKLDGILKGSIGLG